VQKQENAPLLQILWLQHLRPKPKQQIVELFSSPLAKLKRLEERVGQDLQAYNLIYSNQVFELAICKVFEQLRQGGRQGLDHKETEKLWQLERKLSFALQEVRKSREKRLKELAYFTLMQLLIT